MSKEEVLTRLREALLTYDKEATENVAKKALETGIPPLEAIDFLTKTAQEIGEKFSKFEIFLPDLMMAADALTAGMNVLMAKIPKEKAERMGTVVIGTVKGDIHEIGKNIVATMFRASGFDVYDIGKDVDASVFAEAAEKNKADIVATSALMTTTMPMQKEIIDYFKALGIREKYIIIVGGGPVTQEYAEEIGADGYAPDPAEAVKVAKKLLEARAK